jgi:predicted nucleotidyltransferase
MEGVATVQERIAQNRDILDRYAVSRLSVFGSFARAEEGARDIDLLVEFKETPTLVEFIQLQDLLSDLVGMPVDLVSRKACSERFLRNIEGDMFHVA